ncbi:DUF4367 domain-containing protein [Gracilibacillus saliphilus]|uniref:DUF4367 domain-containing protein n=1 Tax=Gracilibacillus saliphilus TaxID=543890 RepID=UPI0013D22001|nr:DUF4367 domain-containing protein [Gracilibacillus saliphilus]
MNEEQNWKEWLNEDYQQVEEAPHSKDENWETIISEISQTNQHQKKIPKKSLLAVAMIIVIVMGSAFVQTNQMQAFDWFVNMFVTTEGDKTQITQTTNEKEPSTDALPDFDNITTNAVPGESKEMTFEEAQDETDFNIFAPSYLPDGYQLESVTVFYEEVSAGEVQLEYVNNLNDNDVIMLYQTYQPDDFSAAKVVDNEDTEIKTIELDGGEARLIEFMDGHIQIIWSTPKTNWLLEGSENKEQLIKVAESIDY